jgi:plasmid stabilization system protein ParE
VSGRDEQPPGAGMTKAEAAALGREVSASVGFRGHLQRLAGGSPEGPSWALRVTSLLTGGSGGLVRSREAWERYHERMQQEVRRMVDTKRTDGTLDGARPSRAPAEEAAPAPEVSRRSTGLEVTMRPDGPTVVPDFLGDQAPPPAAEDQARDAPVPRGQGGRWDVERWRAMTQEAIAQAAEDERRLLTQAEAKREQAQARRKEGEQLRRALAVVAGSALKGRGASPPGGRASSAATLRGRILEWVQAHGGELVVARCAGDTGLSVKRVSDVASQAYREGRLDRLGKGHYRLAAPPSGDPHAPASGGGTLEAEEGQGGD